MSFIAAVDASGCIAQGDCAEIAPEVFRLDDTSVVIGSGPEDLLLEAAEACPTAAISIVDGETGEPIYP
jgi:ferredoxin